MATKAEQAHAEEVREMAKKARAAKAKKKAKAPSKPTKKAKKAARTSRKATVALETQSVTGQPSRKSTRSSANRKRSDTGLTRRAENKESSSDTRFRESKAKSARVRGH